MLSSGEVIKADIVISNADPGITILKLAGEKDFPEGYIKEVKALEYTPGVFLMRFALKEKITAEKFIMTISHPNADEYYEMVENNEIPETVPLMIPVISNLDPTAAPVRQAIDRSKHFPRQESELGGLGNVFDAIFEDGFSRHRETHSICGDCIGRGCRQNGR